jgi:hypothetical protein
MFPSLEEEKFDDFKTGIRYPVNIGDISTPKYQVVGKLGFDVISTLANARPPVSKTCSQSLRVAHANKDSSDVTPN